MIILRQTCRNDLENCLDALMFPAYGNRPPLCFEEAHNYIDDIVEFIYSIAGKPVHRPCVFDDHKPYGEYAARYNRNRYTQYYIIYNRDTAGDIFVEHIMTNHVTGLL